VSSFFSLGFRRCVVAAAFAALVCGPALAQDKVARVPVSIVAGRLVVPCQLAAKKRIAANLFLDYEAPCELTMHNRAAAGIEAEAEDGSATPIKVLLPDIEFEVARRELADDKAFERFTKWYSKELGENAVVGTIGARLLARYHVTFDLAAGFVEFSAPHSQTREPPPAIDGTTVVPITVFNDLVWFPVTFGARRGGAIALGTAKYDSWVDSDLANELGHPAGDVGPVLVGGIDLAPFVAFRPERVPHTHADGVFGVLGLNVLRHFRVEVDRVNRTSRWTNTAPPAFPQDDLDYFRAREQGDGGALTQWLEAHPSARLAPEAAQRLLELRLDEDAGPATLKKAMEFVHATRPADLKATGALELMQTMQQAGRANDALAAAELGLAAGRDDRYPDSVHKLHARMGSILLEQQRTREAWKHLLSAAFGLPDDGPLNLDLARCYEQDGRYGRAYSRYLQALLSPDSGDAAIAGLERVQPKIEDAEDFSVDAIEKLIEGKVEGFGVATKFRPDDNAKPSRTVLIEWFTNAHFEGQIGIALARDGLRDHFGREYAVLVEYDVPEPALTPLVNPLGLRQWERLVRATGAEQTAHVMDGVVALPPAARARDKQAAYDAIKVSATARLQRGSDHAITIDAKADATGIRAQVAVLGPALEHAIVQVLLVERGVLFPGKSRVVIHRNVARAALTTEPDGAPFAPTDERMELTCERTWESIATELTTFLDRREADGAARVSRHAARVDPRQASIVVILRDRESGAVMQAAQVDPTLAEDLQ
jgi:tetratricopeptide (TPR) repeat protein